MDKETINYINTHYSDLQNDKEYKATAHHFAVSCIGYCPPRFLSKLYPQGHLLSYDPKILVLLKDGYNQFLENTAKRILEEETDKVFLNNCLKCGKLARTPKSKQCRYCKYDWH
ncbi:MAG: hypothetical protein ACI81T_002794 [Bacteroidia bacterium]|jgi:hypothetical protein